LATQVASRMREVFRVDLPLRSIFQHATVAGVVAELGSLWGDNQLVEEIAQTVQEVERLTADEVLGTLAAEAQDAAGWDSRLRLA
jgi:hypothetical protein